MGYRSEYRDSTTQTGDYEIPFTNSNLTGFAVDFEGETGDITVTFKPDGFDVYRNPGQFGENIVSQNEGVSFDNLTNPGGIFISPTDKTVEYKISWMRF